MKFKNASMFLGFLMLAASLGAQNNTASEAEIHKNVRLIEMAVPEEMPEELKSKYQSFLPLLKEALRESISAQSSEKALTFRVAPGIKEVGSSKTKRVFAKITAYRRNAQIEFVGHLLLHNYATGETVGKEDVSEFLKKQILGPLNAR